MGRLVGWLLAILGGYIAIFFALLPPDPCNGTCPSSVIVLPQPAVPPDPNILAATSIALGVLALAVGVLGLARSGAFWTSSLLAVGGLYLLVQRILWSPGPLAIIERSASYPEPVAWLSLAVGVVAVVAGLVGFVRGDAGAHARVAH